jgi:hypothetical protein
MAGRFSLPPHLGTALFDGDPEPVVEHLPKRHRNQTPHFFD